MKQINTNSKYTERFIFAEIAKIKDKYKTLGYKVKENTSIRIKQERYLYDLIAEKGNTKIFFEIKLRGNNIDKENIKKKRISTLEKYPNAEFQLIIIEESKKKDIYIHGFDKLLLKLIIEKNRTEFESKYSNFKKIEQVEDVNINTLKIANDKIKINGFAYLSVRFQVQTLEFDGTYIDKIPFSFNISNKGYHPELLYFLMRENSLRNINSNIEFGFQHYTIN